MPQPEATLPRPPTATRAARLASASITGWGLGPPASVRLLRPSRSDELADALSAARALGEAGHGAIARGMGRSYGDAAQLGGGLVLETTRLRRFELDAERGTVRAEAGVTIGELLDAAVPAGWMVPVLPGTQHVSVGGAIASDIHGKNHGAAGTFGMHVEAIGLLTAAEDVVELGGDDPLFQATLGGMGLTGVIVWARIALRRVTSPWLSVDTDRVDTLEDALAALRAPGGQHRVAWLDLLGPGLARGVVTRAEHLDGAAASEREKGSATVRGRATIPAGWPRGMLQPATMRAFNELRFRRSPRARRGAVESIGAHMFPLDALEWWPRLYGPSGFLQYQLVIPYGAERTLESVIARLRRSGVPCYLAVLKDFGPANPAPLSFPLAGWTLTLDVPRVAPGLYELLDRLDEEVVAAGGRVYLSKDARLRPETLAAMYPRLGEWREVRDQADPEHLWQSDLARRTRLVAAPAPAPAGDPAPAPAPARDPAPAPAPAPARARDPAPAPARAPAPAPSDGRAAPLAAPANRVLLVGGTSEIGLAVVRRLAAEGPVRPYLLGRDRERTAAALGDLGLGGDLDVLEADDVSSHEGVIGRAFARTGGFDLVVLAVGVLGGQRGLDAERGEALEVMETNFVGSGSLMLESLRRLREQGSGTLVVLSSVAAERPRASNAIYGAAKAGLDSLAQGLADATEGTGVRVLVVRPGFVTTKMTADLDPAPMAATAEEVAAATVKGLHGSAHTVWVPARLQLVFAVLRHLPRRVFRRLPL
jgi:decaprenylphospho-beta-D-ribofuranose 2-oxidase